MITNRDQSKKGLHRCTHKPIIFISCIPYNTVFLYKSHKRSHKSTLFIIAIPYLKSSFSFLLCFPINLLTLTLNILFTQCFNSWKYWRTWELWTNTEICCQGSCTTKERSLFICHIWQFKLFSGKLVTNTEVQMSRWKLLE